LAVCTQGGRVLTFRGAVRALAEGVLPEEARVWGFEDIEWLWLCLTAVPLVWSSRERSWLPEEAERPDWGRCELDEEAVGGGMGDGSRRVVLFPWGGGFGLRKEAAPLLCSTMGLLIAQ
jgi:hypothetical protein